MPSRVSPTEVPAVDSGVVRNATLEIDGRKLRLVYDFNAIAEAEKEAPGSNLLHGMAALLLNTLSAVQLRGLFFAATRRYHPRITLRDAGQMVRLDTWMAIVAAIREAYALSVPDKSKNPPKAGRTKAAPAVN